MLPNVKEKQPLRFQTKVFLTLTEKNKVFDNITNKNAFFFFFFYLSWKVFLSLKKINKKQKQRLHSTRKKKKNNRGNFSGQIIKNSNVSRQTLSHPFQKSK